MNPFAQFPKFYDQYLLIDKTQDQEYFKEIVNDFFFNCPLHEVRRLFSLLAESALTTDNLDNTDDRKMVLWFVKEIQTVIECAKKLSE